jgi:hypothetical protein
VNVSLFSHAALGRRKGWAKRRYFAVFRFLLMVGLVGGAGAPSAAKHCWECFVV